MAMTYDFLIAEVMQYLDRVDADTLNQVPNFIAQAEEIICREAKNIGFEVYVTGNFLAGNPVIQKPSRWKRNITFNFGTSLTNLPPFNIRNQLYLRSYEFLRSYWPDDTQQDIPKFYSDYGYNNILIAPTPNEPYPFEFSYLEKPEPLSPTHQTNWYTLFAPDVLLYGTLLQTAPYLKSDDRIQVWQGYYKEGIASLNQEDAMRVKDRTALREAD